MAYTNPSVADFQSQFFRDFPYGTDINTQVTDADINSAFIRVNMNINQGLFSDQVSYTYSYNLLAAHYLCENLRASSQGINGQFSWLENSKTVGNVSEAFSIPQWVLDNPLMSQLSKTNYGAQYLETVLPQLSGAMFTGYMPAHAL